MLADLLYSLYPYQIFRSILFRAGMGYLTVYALVSFAMPFCIRYFRRKRYVSDFHKPRDSSGPYSGPVPIMGGAVLIFAILISVSLWCWFNEYIFALLAVMLFFGGVGLLDDIGKIKSLKRQSEASRPEYAEKADGISGKFRLISEFLFCGVVLWFLVSHLGILSPALQIPGIPIKNLHPTLSEWLYVLFAMFVVVGGANAVNLSDGLDTLATIPLLYTLIFIAAASYVGAELLWSEKLKLIYLGEEMKQISILTVIIIGSLVSFLKYNSPPANIYLGDVGSLGIGSVVCTLFLFVKAELFLPIVGGGFVIAALSAIVQRFWFFLMAKLHGREYAKKNRFFYRAPYHHHNQSKYNFHPSGINSLYARFVNLLIPRFWPKIDQYASKESINSKVIWNNHIKTLWFLVIAFIIYFKVR